MKNTCLDSASEKTRLASYLDKEIASGDSAQDNNVDVIPHVAIAPQPAIMEVETQSRIQWLISKELLVSSFEKTLIG